MSANLILLQGKSGTGKSTSLRNIPADEAFVIRPNAKRFPFPGSVKKYSTDRNVVITQELKDIPGLLLKVNTKFPHVKYIIVEDFSHYFTARTTSDSFQEDMSNKGFGKWNKFGADVFKAISGSAEQMREDIHIIFVNHTETDENGYSSFKTAGQMMRNQIEIPSYFTCIFHTHISKEGTDGKMSYKMYTNNPGNVEAKTPMGMFEDMLIDNDLYEAIKRIDAYNNGEVEIS